MIKLGGVLDADGTLALAQGDNFITVEVTAEDGVSGETYAVTVTREAPASDATLSALALSRITLDPAFAAETTAYTATVDYAVDETAVTPTTNHGGAGYVIKLGGVLDADGTLALAQGANVITVEVTAEDGVSGETYAVTVTREAPASDATLSALALSRITLDPAFAAETTAYAATVDYAVEKVKVKPTTNHGGAGYVIKLGGVLDADGTLALAQGANVITVEVTAEDGVSGETYAVTVTREAPASDATLSALALSRITLDPAFAAETNAYTATVDYAVDETAVTPTTNHGGAGYVIKLGGVLDADGTLALAQGDNFITVEVTAEDGVSGETYAVTVTREAPASDATLSALALSRITLDPAFAAETNAYAATVDYAVEKVKVTPTTNHGGAGYVIKLGGVLDADGTLALAQGDNFITVEVTAEDGVSGETYAVTVTREAPASDATLSALALSRITLDPAFAAETNAYAATVDYAVDETAVTPTTNHGGAGYVIKLGGVLDADGTLALAQGDNFITVEVTAEDGVSGETYAVTVTREAPASDATLSALALSRITLDPAFAAETTAYTATVDYAVEKVKVKPTTNHGGAGYVIKLGGVLDADGTLPLAQGDNFITVEVTAEDGVSGETYAVTVTREETAARSIDSFVPILVSNTAQTANANATYSRDHGQAFTTGANAGGYTVSGVTIISTDPDDDAIALQICEVDDDTHPTSTCTDLTPPSSSAEGPLEFTIAQGTSLTLAAATTYMLVFKAPSLGQIRVAATTSDDEDSDSLPGWSIRDKFQWKNTQDMWADASRHNAIRIAILGNVAITPGLDISQAALTVVEGNAAGQSYTVALTTQPSAAVTVTISGQASSDLVVDPSSLTFSTSNWSSPQTVTVTASEDADALTDPVVTLTHRASGGDYGAVTGDLRVTITDDDDSVSAPGDIWVLVGQESSPLPVSHSVTGSGHTATVNWGDGSAEVSLGPVAGGTFNLPGHTYSEPSVYTVTVVVTNNEGDSRSARFVARVGADVALGAVASGSGLTGDAFKVVDDRGDTSVSVAGSWSVEVDLADAFRVGQIRSSPPSGGTLAGFKVETRVSTTGDWVELGRVAGAGGGTITTASAGGTLARYVRATPLAALADGATNTIATIEVSGLTQIALADISPSFAGSLSDAGLTQRGSSFSIAGGKLVSGSGNSSFVVADLCDGCDLDHEAVRQATVTMLVEFPATNPSGSNTGVSLGVGFEESRGRQRGVLAELGPWKPVSTSAGPLTMSLYCGGGSGGGSGPSRLRGWGVNLDCSRSSVQKDFVEHTAQDLSDAFDPDVTLPGSRVWVELEYRNLKLWVRVWPEGGQRPVLPRGGIRFGTEHYTNRILSVNTFKRDDTWLLNPGRLSLRAWGFSSSNQLKIESIEVSDLLVGPRLGSERGSARDADLTYISRYYPMGKAVAAKPAYAADYAANKLPKVVVDDDPGYVSLYDKAWELAYDRTRVPSAREPWYRTWLDEAHSSEVYMWDIAAMMWFAKYMNAAFDPMGSLEIFYQTQRDDGGIGHRFQESTGRVKSAALNPPLFAWAEWQWYETTGDLDRVRRVLPAVRENLDYLSIVRWAQNSAHRLYWNDWGGSGLDELRRPYPQLRDGGKQYGDPDISAQMAQAYMLLGDMYEVIGDSAEAERMRAIGEAIGKRINRFLWKDFTDDGTDYGQWFYANKAGNIVPSGSGYVDAPQGPGLWYSLVGATTEQARRLKNIMSSEDWYFTDMPFGTLPKSHSQFQGWGGHSQGSVYPPILYMGIKGAREHRRLRVRPGPAEAVHRRHGRGV